MLYSNEPHVIAASVRLAEALAGAQRARRLLLQLGAADALVQLLQRFPTSPGRQEDENAAWHAAAALARLAQDPSARARLVVEPAFVDVLLAQVGKQPCARSGCCWCAPALALATLAADADFARAVVRSARASALVDAIAAPCPEAARAALWAVCCCARVPECASRLCECGALERIADIGAAAAAAAAPRVPSAKTPAASAAGAATVAAKNSLQMTAERALEALEASNASARYWLRGRLAGMDHLPAVFYEFGAGPHFTSLAALKAAPVRPGAPTVLLVDDTADTSLTAHLARARDAVAAAAVEHSGDADAAVAALAQYVSAAMGGAQEWRTYTNFGCECEVNAVKRELGSNVVPLGALGKGTCRHRALLCKFLADRLASAGAPLPPVSLHAGTDFAGAPHAWCCAAMGARGDCVVDLMHMPGALYPQGSDEATAYLHTKE
eukprot:TRINITY_DN52_c1_g1_i1.p1 TRINITY_DN52_c1_g1~~TRINITY_DN52_c1_g1_i1.p1  ORF type:complete len:441 (+),score=112.81 TRINITY_DN52_c1_g1_i1:530-1852(+)